jgi:SAM-dependent methyltransferase
MASKVQIYDPLAEHYDGFGNSELYRAEDRVLKRMLRGVSGKVLDLGCGTGYLIDLLDLPPQDYLGVDLSPRMLERAESKFPRHSFHQADQVRTGLPSEGFDAVVNMWAMHYADPQAALLEATRLLKPGGRFFVVVYGTWPAGVSPLPYETWGCYEKSERRGFTARGLRELLGGLDDVQVRGLTPYRVPRLLQIHCMPFLAATVGRAFPDSCYYLVAQGVKSA